MRTSIRLSALVPVACAALVLAGCGMTRASVYQQEDFAADETFSRMFPGSDAETCEAARRALLSQGYIITEARRDFVNGHKSFQPKPDTHLEIEFHVVCTFDDKDTDNGRKVTMAFASALQERYALRKSSTSASVGVSALGSVSLPFGSSDDSLVKVGSETIASHEFYDRFFVLVERYLGGDTWKLEDRPAEAARPDGTQRN